MILVKLRHEYSTLEIFCIYLFTAHAKVTYFIIRRRQINYQNMLILEIIRYFLTRNRVNCTRSTVSSIEV
jgi:hypothetical protein